MKDPKINYLEYELENGEHVAMSTAPILLLRLSSKNKAAYKKMSTLMIKGVNEDDVMGLYEILYNAYLNANQDEENMSFTEFIESANGSFQYNAEKAGELLGDKKKQDSETHSEEQ